jgi:hypothetical protein
VGCAIYRMNVMPELRVGGHGTRPTQEKILSRMSTPPKCGHINFLYLYGLCLLHIIN